MQFVQELLYSNQDKKYADFEAKLIPSVLPQKIIGVRTPILRKMAKGILNDERCVDFLKEKPHEFFEENQIHGFIVSAIKDFDRCIFELEDFLPFIDNWATCDQTSPKVFQKNHERLLPYIKKWLTSSHVYTVRFAIGMFMQHFLDEDFSPEYIQLVANIKSEDYYIKMEQAWYMATALFKQWESAFFIMKSNTLEKWTHNKTIQKAKESYRLQDWQKEEISRLRQSSIH